MKTIFKNGDITIKTKKANGMGCDECFFGKETKDGWECDKDKWDEWGGNLPDCVFDFSGYENIIYIKID